MPIDLSDVSPSTRAALHYAGLRDDEVDTRITKYCICKIRDDPDIETVIRCDNRNCRVQWFHLNCVGLPDHPPSRFIWLCPYCRRNSSTRTVAGLVSSNTVGRTETSQARAWLTEEVKLQKEEAKLQREQAKLRNDQAKLQIEQVKLQHEQAKLQKEGEKLQKQQAKLQMEEAKLQTK